jgi:acetyl-CoA carboxylase biotin carboxyl carrier protein
MSTPKDAFDPDLIRDLAKLLDETGLNEIEIEKDGARVRVGRQTGTPAAAVTPTAAPAVTPVMPVLPELRGGPANHPGLVTSPMVGTAYLASEPGARPFVDIGSDVKVGDTLLIIEAMKTMNHIPAPRAGKVVQIFVEDSQPVEFAEPLMIVE